MIPGVNLPAFKPRYLVFFLTATVIVVADQLTKAWIRDSLEIGETLWRYGILSITRVTPNTGASFGLFPGSTLPLVIVTSIFMIVMLVYVFVLYRRVPWMDRGLFWLALGLIMGGSVGNFVDRTHPALEGVTDFVSIGWFPTFNVADSGVTVGAVLFVVGFLLYGREGLTDSD
jgi:signal peptidase II